MKPLLVAEDILPFAEFKAHASEVVRGLGSRGRPVIVTQNGRPAAVLLSPEEYDRLSARARFLDAVHEGLADDVGDRVVSDEALAAELDRELGEP